MDEEGLRGATAERAVKKDQIVAHLPAHLAVVLGPKGVPSEVCRDNPSCIHALAWMPILILQHKLQDVERCVHVQEHCLLLLRLRKGNPMWNESMAPYWGSFPPIGSSLTKHTYPLEHLDLLQDKVLVSS